MAVQMTRSGARPRLVMQAAWDSQEGHEFMMEDVHQET